jgi:hypothetical protein
MTKALIILGCAPQKDSTPSLRLASRIELGKKLFKEETFDKVIFSGGPNKTPIPESTIMRALCPEMGGIEEDKSMNTYENIKNCIPLVKGCDEVHIVTSSFHVPRVKRIAKDMINARIVVHGAANHMTGLQELIATFKEKRKLRYYEKTHR